MITLGPSRTVHPLKKGHFVLETLKLELLFSESRNNGKLQVFGVLRLYSNVLSRILAAIMPKISY